jgi:hypothetical protein
MSTSILLLAVASLGACAAVAGAVAVVVLGLVAARRPKPDAKEA